MSRRSGLGRGLSALIPADLDTPAESALQELLLTQITPSRFQPRARFDEESLVALTASIRELGVLQPVLVRPADEDRFELIAGERRWRAAKRAGLQTIPALVREVGLEGKRLAVEVNGHVVPRVDHGDVVGIEPLPVLDVIEHLRCGRVRGQQGGVDPVSPPAAASGCRAS